MFFTLDVVNLGLYVMQQLGVMFGVGSETIILVAYLLAIRDKIIDTQEERFAHAVKRVQRVGIALILLSGVGITLLEFLAKDQSVVFSPAYLFKCLLIGLTVLFAAVLRGESLPEGVLEGVAGGTWYALFIVHILAPEATWGELGSIYGVWLVVFMCCWLSLLFFLRGSKIAPADEPTPATQSTTAAPKPYRYAPAPPTKTRVSMPPPAPPKNVPSYTHIEDDSTLPAIRVMPKNPGDITAQDPGTVIRFS